MFTCMGFKMGYSFIVYLAFLVIRMKMSLFLTFWVPGGSRMAFYLVYMYISQRKCALSIQASFITVLFQAGCCVFCTRTFANYSSKLGLKHFFLCFARYWGH